jgi:hypothetical protein
VLTKTHCGGYCDDCPASTYVRSLRQFTEDCGRTQYCHPQDDVPSKFLRYSPQQVDAAVHLIRSPFDNLVARQHLAVKRRRNTGWSDAELEPFVPHVNQDGSNFTKEQAFGNWCRHIDELFDQSDAQQDLLGISDPAIWEEFLRLPCRAEWYRYVQWHNRAVQLTVRQELPTHYLHYDEYSTDYDGTVQRLMEFLELGPPHRDGASNEPSAALRAPLAFIPGKTYDSYFSDETRRQAGRVVRALATPECWYLLRRYF